MRVETSKQPENTSSQSRQRLRKGRERGKAMERRCHCKMCFLILEAPLASERKLSSRPKSNGGKWRNLEKPSAPGPATLDSIWSFS
jgi:hypothetical protein